MSHTELRNEILRLNSLYRQGKPEVSDVEYDALVDDEVARKECGEEDGW